MNSSKNKLNNKISYTLCIFFVMYKSPPSLKETGEIKERDVTDANST